MTGFYFVLVELGETVWRELRKRPLLGGLVGFVAIALSFRLVILVASALFSSEPGRMAVSGTISFDGRPLENGVVCFESFSDRKDACVAYVQAGQFQVPRKHGLPPGTYRVRVTQSVSDYSAWSPEREPAKRNPKTTGKPPRTPVLAEAKPLIVPSLIPDRYNRNTELTIEVGRWSSNRVHWELSSLP